MEIAIDADIQRRRQCHCSMTDPKSLRTTFHPRSVRTSKKQMSGASVRQRLQEQESLRQMQKLLKQAAYQKNSSDLDEETKEDYYDTHQ